LGFGTQRTNIEWGWGVVGGVPRKLSC
jgi:hypothetical protein